MDILKPRKPSYLTVSFIKYYSIVAFLLIGFNSVSQKHNILNYSTRDGLSSQIVNDVFQDKDGYLWFATQSGISKFDGHEFTEFAPVDKLIGVDAVTIIQDKKGRIIIGTNTNGLFIHDFKSTKNYYQNNGLASNVVRKLFIDNSGVLWVLTDKGVYKFIDDKLIPVNDSKRFFKDGVLSMTQTKNGDLWFGTQGKGLVSYSKNHFNYFGAKDGILDDYIFSLATKGDSVLIGTTNKGVYIGYKNVFQPLMKKEIENAWISAILPSKNELHIISSNGLVIVKNSGAHEHISEKNGLASNDLYNGFFDRERNLWLTSGNGISCLRKEEIISIDKEAGLSDDKITSITQLSDGSIAVGTYGSGVNLLNAKGEVLRQIKPDILINAKITTLQEVPFKKELWIGLEQSDYALIILDTETFAVKKKIQRIKGVFLQTITKISVDEQNRIWVGTFNAGLFRISAKDTLSYNIKNLLPSNEVYTFLIDKSGVPWVSLYQKGLYKLDKGSFKRIYDKKLLTDKFIQSLELDANGALYIGTKSHGITIFKNGKFTQVNKTDGLTSNSIQSLVSNGNQLWLGTERGVQLIKFDGNGKFTITTYDNRSGLSNLEVQQNALLFTDNAIWVGSTTGLSRINHKINERSKTKPLIALKSIKLFYNPVDWTKKKIVELNKFGIPIALDLPYKENHLTFEYSALTNSSVSYSFMLVGEDATWSPLTDKREVTYSNLSPGNYTFKVKSIDNFGVESIELSIPVIINSPFWQTLWFRISLILVIVILIVSFIRVRERNYRTQQIALEKTVQERTKEVVLESNKAEQQKKLVELKNKEILDSITYAKRIQTAMLPSNELLQKAFGMVTVVYMPKDIVAGDFYWFDQFEHLKLIGVADCTGHGVPGAMVSVVCNNALNRATREYGLTQPAKILDKTRELILSEFSKNEQDIKDGMDISLACYNENDRTLEWSGANLSLWILKSNSSEIIEIKGDKQPIGSHVNNNLYTNHSIQLETGDSFYLFSDGFPDQFGGPNGKKLKSASLKKIILSNGSVPFEKHETLLKNYFNEWKGDQEQVDDVCLLGIKIS